mmetsp:Transcript_74962/g.231818  ORF Transcript_74962/g.231818 Transcript_74962/m.231818 type:complete len:243 (-) Transcript_74962:165-893(-)
MVLLFRKTDTWLAVVAALNSEQDFFLRSFVLCLPPSSSLEPKEPPLKIDPVRSPRQTLSKASWRCEAESGCLSRPSCDSPRRRRPARSSCADAGPAAAARSASRTETSVPASLWRPTRKDQPVVGCLSSDSASSQANISPPLRAFTSSAAPLSPPPLLSATLRHSSAARSSRSRRAVAASSAGRPAARPASAAAASESARQEQPASLSVWIGISPSGYWNKALKPELAWRTGKPFTRASQST